MATAVVVSFRLTEIEKVFKKIGIEWPGLKLAGQKLSEKYKVLLCSSQDKEDKVNFIFSGNHDFIDMMQDFRNKGLKFRATL